MGSEADSNYTIEWCGVWMGGCRWVGVGRFWDVGSGEWKVGGGYVGRGMWDAGCGTWCGRWNCSRLGCEMSERVVCGVEW